MGDPAGSPKKSCFAKTMHIFWGERSNSEYSLLKRNNRTLAVKKFWYTYEEYDREESAAYDEAQNG